jgi:hemerythrin-like domain-containing protein
MRGRQSNRQCISKVGEFDMQPLGPRSAIQVILNEHRQLSAIIEGMLRFTRLLETGSKAPGLMVFRAMLYYIREYPEQVHHRKEDRYLFARLRARTDEFDDVLDELEAQHAEGDARVRVLPETPESGGGSDSACCETFADDG